MSNLTILIIAGLVRMALMLCLVIFVPAGEEFRQGWSYITVFMLAILSMVLLLGWRDLHFLERRLNASSLDEKLSDQKIIHTMLSMLFGAELALCGIDHRFHWSRVYPHYEIVGETMLLLGLLIIFFVIKVNTFATATIEIAEDHKVITTGPYRFVRHPMYAGLLVLLLGTPPALGSWVGLVFFFPMLVVLLKRLFSEEKYLKTYLPGYEQYTQKVQSRLIPYVW